MFKENNEDICFIKQIQHTERPLRELKLTSTCRLTAKSILSDGQDPLFSKKKVLLKYTKHNVYVQFETETS